MFSFQYSKTQKNKNCQFFLVRAMSSFRGWRFKEKSSPVLTLFNSPESKILINCLSRHSRQAKIEKNFLRLMPRLRQQFGKWMEVCVSKERLVYETQYHSKKIFWFKEKNLNQTACSLLQNIQRRLCKELLVVVGKFCNLDKASLDLKPGFNIKLLYLRRRLLRQVRYRSLLPQYCYFLDILIKDLPLFDNAQKNTFVLEINRCREQFTFFLHKQMTKSRAKSQFSDLVDSKFYQSLAQWRKDNKITSFSSQPALQSSRVGKNNVLLKSTIFKLSLLKSTKAVIRQNWVSLRFTPFAKNLSFSSDCPIFLSDDELHPLRTAVRWDHTKYKDLTAVVSATRLKKDLVKGIVYLPQSWRPFFKILPSFVFVSSVLRKKAPSSEKKSIKPLKRFVSGWSSSNRIRYWFRSWIKGHQTNSIFFLSGREKSNFSHYGKSMPILIRKSLAAIQSPITVHQNTGRGKKRVFEVQRLTRLGAERSRALFDLRSAVQEKKGSMLLLDIMENNLKRVLGGIHSSRTILRTVRYRTSRRRWFWFRRPAFVGKV